MASPSLGTLRIGVVGAVGACGLVALYKWQYAKPDPILVPSSNPSPLPANPIERRIQSVKKAEFARFRKGRLLPVFATTLSSLGLTYAAFKLFTPNAIPVASAGIVSALSAATLLLTPSKSFKEGVWHTPLGKEDLTPFQAYLTLGMYSTSLGYFLRSVGVQFSAAYPFSIATLGVFAGHTMAVSVCDSTVPYVLHGLASSTVVGNWLLGELVKKQSQEERSVASLVVSVVSAGVAVQALMVQSDKWKRGVQKKDHPTIVVQDAFHLQTFILFVYSVYAEL